VVLARVPSPVEALAQYGYPFGAVSAWAAGAPAARVPSTARTNVPRTAARRCLNVIRDSLCPLDGYARGCQWP
jgi:hypothetical protein